MKEIYSLNIEDVFKGLNSNERGLSEKEAQNRFEKIGPNKLPEPKVDGMLLIFLRQFKSPLIYVLLVAAILILLIGEKTDSLIIMAVLLLNAVIGAFQEGKAQNTLLALKKLVAINTTVLRDGKELIIPHGELVPGDIIILEEGEKIPADARLISCYNLRADEAILTGESVPKNKLAEPIKGSGITIADQKNMIFRGTNILSGNGKAIVINTGARTVIGKISEKITSIETEIPLKKNIRQLSNAIIIAVAVISSLLLALGILRGEQPLEMIIVVVSLAVSIIPEGLPVVLTLVLATGVWRMSRRNALIKKLQAVEALGQAKIIAVDKTGTLTKNQLLVQNIYVGGNFFSVSGKGYEPRGEFKLSKEAIAPLNHPELIMAGKIAVLTSDAHIAFEEETKTYKITGDPTEAAMLVLGEKLGFHKNELEKEIPQILEVPFDYKLKYHLVINKENNKEILSIAGAPEVILSKCKKIWHPEKITALSEKKKQELESVFLKMSKKGFRTIAFAIKNNPKFEAGKDIDSLTFVGFYFMRDIIREEVFEAVRKTKEAGVRIVMITGDHKITAKTIAEEVGIYKDGDEILTGDELDKLNEKQLMHKLGKATVFARVTPEHKLKIIEGYKKRGEIIAMTGDGVNDALSLVAADLGVSMGLIGTEVAKEASDIILMDDNFGSITAAIEEGRSIYKTIKKVILYLVSTSVGEALVIVVAMLLGYPLPILAVQILWLNLVTDGFLNIALALEPKESGLLKNYKHSAGRLIDKLMIKRIFVMTIPMMIGTIYLFDIYQGDYIKATTIALTAMAVFQWFNAWNCRSEKKSIFSMNPFSNIYLIGTTLIVIALQLLAVYAPLMQKLLHTAPLNLEDWFIIIFIASSIIIAEEARKILTRLKIKAPQKEAVSHGA